MSIDVHQFRIFLAVAQSSGFGRAAVRLRLSQSAVSLSIRQMEADLGQKLFDRTTRQVQLTAAGELLQISAQRIVEDFDAALSDLRALKQGARGSVAVSCVQSIAGSLLPRALAEAARRRPDISMRVRDEPAFDVLRRVVDGEVDFGVTSGPLERAELVQEHLVVDPFCLVCRRDHPIARIDPPRWRDLAGQPMVMLDNNSGSRWLIERALATNGVQVETRFELTLPGSVAGMVEAGLGLAVLPELATPPFDHPTLLTRVLTEPEASRRILLIRRRDRPLSAAAGVLWGALRDLFGDRLLG